MAVTVDVFKSPLSVRLDRDSAMFHQFFLSAKRIWGTTLYSRVVAEAQRLAASVSDPDKLHARLLSDSPSYQVFAWVEHDLQQFKYAGRYGLVPQYEQAADIITRTLDRAQREGAGAVHLHPNLEMRGSYTQGFTHLADRYLLSGDQERGAARLREYADAGADSVVGVLACPRSGRRDQIERLAAEQLAGGEVS